MLCKWGYGTVVPLLGWLLWRKRTVSQKKNGDKCVKSHTRNKKIVVDNEHN